MMIVDNKARKYNILSSFYDRLFFVLRPGHKKVGEYLAKEGCKNILEVGIGTGLTLEHYPAACQITGIDMSQGMLEEAKEKLGDFPHVAIHLEQMDAQNLKFEDNSFDCTYAPSLLTVVPDPEKLLEEMIRVTRPGGKLIIIAHFKENNLPSALFSKVMNPVTQLLFGFRMDLEEVFFKKFPQVKILKSEKVNPVGIYHLSHLIILEKDNSIDSD